MRAQGAACSVQSAVRGPVAWVAAKKDSDAPA